MYNGWLLCLIHENNALIVASITAIRRQSTVASTFHGFFFLPQASHNNWPQGVALPATCLKSPLMYDNDSLQSQVEDGLDIQGVFVDMQWLLLNLEPLFLFGQPKIIINNNFFCWSYSVLHGFCHFESTKDVSRHLSFGCEFVRDAGLK